jgi:hypothetical protein
MRLGKEYEEKEKEKNYWGGRLFVRHPELPKSPALVFWGRWSGLGLSASISPVFVVVVFVSEVATQGGKLLTNFLKSSDIVCAGNGKSLDGFDRSEQFVKGLLDGRDVNKEPVRAFQDWKNPTTFRGGEEKGGEATSTAL